VDCGAALPGDAECLEGGKNLHPDGQHPDEQRDRRQRSSFLDDGTEHDSISPGTKEEHSSPSVPKSQQEKPAVLATAALTIDREHEIAAAAGHGPHDAIMKADVVDGLVGHAQCPLRA
jgi:hypothetical protein